jgi:hypothetical protein
MIRLNRIVISSVCFEHHLSGSCSGCASLYTECWKKAGKIVRSRLIWRLKGGQIEVADLTGWLGETQTGGNDMGGTDKNNEPPKNEPPKKDDGKSKKSPPATTEDDDSEDGDFATPKRDRYGDDDQPL